MDKSTLSNYGWVVIVTLVLAVMLALATPFGSYVGKGASNVIKTFVNTSNDAIDEDNIDVQSNNWDDYLNDDMKSNYTINEINNNPLLFGIGKTKPEYVVAEFNEDFTVVNIRANGKDSDGIMMDWPDGDSPFLEITTLTTVHVRKYVKNIGAVAFPELPELTTVIFSEGLEKIGELAFAYCDKLTEVKFPNTLYTIENEAFFWCKNLSNVTFNNGLQTMGDSVFASCSSLKEGLIPETVTSLGTSTFSNCGSLQKASIPQNIVNLPSGTFSNCSKLTDFTISSNLKTIGKYAFQGCDKLTELIIPDGVTTIESGAITSCYSLTNLILPKNLVTIGESAFARNDHLKELRIPNKVIKLPKAFVTASSLNCIYVPNSVTEVTSQAFTGLPIGVTIYCENNSVATLVENSITGNEVGKYNIIVDASQF